jgi:hypothetical protein
MDNKDFRKETPPSPAPIDQPKDQGPKEYWKQVIAEIRICCLPPDTQETVKSICLQPSTAWLAKFIAGEIQSLTSENTALQSKVEALEKEREDYREMLEQMQGWVQIKNLLAKYPPSQQP